MPVLLETCARSVRKCELRGRAANVQADAFGMRSWQDEETTERRAVGMGFITPNENPDWIL